MRHSKIRPPMSALGQKQISEYARGMSALPPKADIDLSFPDIVLPQQLIDLLKTEIIGWLIYDRNSTWLVALRGSYLRLGK